MNIRQCLLAISGCLLLSCGTASADSFRVGYFSLPPHSPDPEQPRSQGAAIDYFKQIASHMQLPAPSFQRYPLSRLLKKLEDGELDMALFLAKNPQRAARLSYPSQPFFRMQPSLVLLLEHPLQEIHDVDDLLQLKIGVWQQGYRSPIMQDPRLHLDTLSTDNVIAQQLRKLQAKHFDAFYTPDLYAVHESGQHGFAGTYKILPLPGEQVGLYSVFSAKAGARYLKAYETALRITEKHQTYEQLLREQLQQPATANR